MNVLSFPRKRESIKARRLFHWIPAFAGMTKAASWSAPLVHFLLVGALLFAAKSLWQSGGDAQVIRVSAAEIARLRADWLRDTAREPSDAQLQASLRRHVDEEILLREALALRLDELDPVARERLTANMRFAFPESADTDAGLLAEARALGLNRRDIVVRRRLVQLMEMRIAGRAAFEPADLQAYLDQHAARYAIPPRYAFRHVFIAGDTPAGAETRALQLLARLREGRQVAGDPFLLGAEFAPQSVAELDRAFGPGFGSALSGIEAGSWSGPLRSAYGFHLVRVERVEAGGRLPAAEVSQRAAYALLAEREKALLQDELARLRERYRIELPASAIVVGLAR